MDKLNADGWLDLPTYKAVFVDHIAADVKFCFQNQRWIGGAQLLMSAIDITAGIERPAAKLDTDRADFIAFSVPSVTVVLHDVNLQLAERLLELDVASDPASHAARLGNLAIALGDCGQREKALEAAQEALALYRDLARQRPDAFAPNLASSLITLANRLSELGQREKALEAAQVSALQCEASADRSWAARSTSYSTATFSAVSSIASRQPLRSIDPANAVGCARLRLDRMRFSTQLLSVGSAADQRAAAACWLSLRRTLYESPRQACTSRST